MKQITQNLANGETRLTASPAMKPGEGALLIRSERSLVSAGTERMLVDFGRAGWVNKARQQPDKVREVLEKVGTDGLATTVDAVRSKLDEPLPLGYCNVGVVAQTGAGVDGFAVGDRVASNGAHAELVNVPNNLCAHIPLNVSDDEAAFTVIGAIALQGIRLAQPTLGECFVVTGLGLVGLLAVQLLRAQGCRVLGIDLDPAKTEMARRFGAEIVSLDQGEDPVSAAMTFSRGRGVDGVLLTLAAKSSEPVSEAAQMCRKRGRVVLVGVTGLELNRADFYEKELTFQVSCSYGPGRYDREYEQGGHDYPVGFVRWTEQRNFEAVLDMMAAGSLDVKPLITHRFAFDEAPEAYDLLATGSEPYLGILLEYYQQTDAAERTVRLTSRPVSTIQTDTISLGVIGAGNYAGRVLIPAFKAAGAYLHTIANSGGVAGAHYGRKYDFEEATTDVDALLGNSAVNAVVIATRHDSHAHYVQAALEAGKHVFVEKPLALRLDELGEIRTACDQTATTGEGPCLMVGFNRRFAPHVAKMKALLQHVKEPKSFIFTVNAGAIPTAHWTQNPAVGGGRLIGEACHFIDLLRYLAGTPINGYEVETLGEKHGPACSDKATITLRFADGSVGMVHYLANGHKGFPKERLEVFTDGRVLQLDNFRKLRAWGWKGFSRMSLWRQDKGQAACTAAFVDAIRGGKSAPIPFDELLEVSRVTIEIAAAARPSHSDCMAD